ncbi:YigZ family protein [Marinobacter confluentis]|uniref:YigZ family protein n=1 Tax=Marinobacter confluentis TaxID=1697557 RepID=A0A4Z1BSK7_9GAMM|nr:YigZ family protein [Marinobacter confluentis]TGN40705.1 YigZ family protein [Marinobacter confluentis]
MAVDYPVPAGLLERETEIKKSRFIARVVPVSNREQVKAWLAEARADHPDARHICWAYQIGQPGAAAEAAMNDDGEPSGTAGKPILGVIQHKDMGDVLVMVIRYFGGVKLGAGGLVRAYAGAAESVLSEVERVVQKPLEEVRVNIGFADEQPLRHWCESNDAVIENVDYGATVKVTMELPQEKRDGLIEFCNARGLNILTESQHTGVTE